MDSASGFTRWRTKAAVAVVLAVVAGLVLVAAPAGAITGDSDLDAVTSTSIGLGKANQLAGGWTLTPDVSTNTWSAGEQVTVEIDDSDGSACAGGDTLAFNTLPSVSDDGTVVFVSSIESTGAGCGNDRLRLNITGAGTGTFTISNVRFDVGTTSALGSVGVTAADTVGAIDVSTASNAFITSALFTANNPPHGAELSSGFATHSPLVVAEQTTTALDGTAACFTLSGGNTWDTATPVPTVAVTGGDDTAVLTLLSSTVLEMAVTAGSAPADAATFTVSGLRYTTTSDEHDTAVVTQDAAADDCASPTATLSVATTVGYVGDTFRLGGSDRFATAEIIFEDEFGCVDDAIIARGDLFPDALAASYLAGNLGTGILLTNPGQIPSSTLNALRAEGVDNVYIVGGTGAVSTAVENQLKATQRYNCGGGPVGGTTPNLSVTRIGGANREETARLIAEFPGLGNAGTADYDGTPADPDGTTCSAKKTAIVATSGNFPDALVAGTLAYQGGAGVACGNNGEIPLLLTHATALHNAAKSGLTNLGIEQALIMGGTGAISAGVEASIQALGITTKRFAGANRNQTATLFATFVIDFLAFDDDDLSVARGDLFPDALAGGPHGGDLSQAIILTVTPTSLGTDSTAFLIGSGAAFADTMDFFDVYGGTGAVSAGVLQEVLNAMSQSVPA